MYFACRSTVFNCDLECWYQVPTWKFNGNLQGWQSTALCRLGMEDPPWMQAHHPMGPWGNKKAARGNMPLWGWNVRPPSSQAFRWTGWAWRPSLLQHAKCLLWDFPRLCNQVPVTLVSLHVHPSHCSVSLESYNMMEEKCKQNLPAVCQYLCRPVQTCL